MNSLVKEVLEILISSGFKAYIVGGYVRDYLLGIKSNDYDICTNAKENDLKKLFNVIDSNYGSCKVEYRNHLFEITTFRKDLNYLNHRKPEQIIFVDNLGEDLVRRDFTINTICMDKDNNIIDLLNARDDLQAKIIKVVGNTEEKMKEDALRILRAIRFATILNFSLDSQLYESIKKYGYLVKNLSYYRRRQELDKIFTSNNIEYGIKLIKELNLAKYLEIRTDFKITSLMGIWAQINNFNYPFTKEEKQMRNDYLNKTYL
ncbi:MAG: hypothetical protein IJR82_05945 [Bacilli bacterium]|nr:hypothetical protein [Bacilli bacterium]